MPCRAEKSEPVRAPQHLREGEDELAVRDFMANGAAIHPPVCRTRRWWQAGQKCWDLQVSARGFSWPQSGQ